jgi:protein-S-isoprenylcysteine O-methyltransferase Ste14
MSLGIFLFYGGFGIWVGSISAILIVLIFAILLVAYIKVFEEKELEARFGNEYLEYKLNTPFLVPDFRRRKRK